MTGDMAWVLPLPKLHLASVPWLTKLWLSHLLAASVSPCLTWERCWRCFPLPLIPKGPCDCPHLSPRATWLLTVSVLHPGVVALLPEADVAQVQDPCHDLQHQLLVLAADADDLHGILGVHRPREPRPSPRAFGDSPPSQPLTMVSWKSLRSSVPSTW